MNNREFVLLSYPCSFWYSLAHLLDSLTSSNKDTTFVVHFESDHEVPAHFRVQFWVWWWVLEHSAEQSLPFGVSLVNFIRIIYYVNTLVVIESYDLTGRHTYFSMAITAGCALVLFISLNSSRLKICKDHFRLHSSMEILIKMSQCHSYK